MTQLRGQRAFAAREVLLAFVVTVFAFFFAASARADYVVTSSFGEQGTEGGKFEGGATSPRGIAVNSTTGHVYVSDSGNNRIQEFNAAGVFERTWGWDVVASGPGQASEIQRVTVNASAGNFILTFGSGGPGISETAEIPATATAAQVQAALNAISNISVGGGSVTVTGGPGNAGGTNPYYVTFGGGPLAESDVALMISATGGTPLSGGSGAGANSAAVALGNDGGVGFEICQKAGGETVAEFSARCKAGAVNNAAGGIPQPVGIAVSPISGHVYAASSSGLRIAEYTANGSFVRTWGLSVVSAGPDNVVPASSVQKVKIPLTVSEGTFSLEFAGRKTGPLSYNASAATVQAALRALTPLGAPGTNVNAAGTPVVTGVSDGLYTITFAGHLKNSPMPQLSVDSTSLVGGVGSVEQSVTGVSSFEICNAGIDTCVGGDTGRINGSFSTAASGKIAVDPITGNVHVTDLLNARVEMFSPNGNFIQAYGWRVDASAPADQPQVCPSSHVCLAATAGGAIGQFGAPVGAINGIAVDSDHNVFVVDSGNKRVQRLQPSGPIGEPTSYSAQAFGPSGVEANPFAVAIDPPTDNVLVGRRTAGANTAMRIALLDPAGQLLETMGEGSSFGEGQLPAEAETSGAGAIATQSSASPEAKAYLAVPQASAAKKVAILGEIPAPECTTQAVASVGATTAQFKAIVTPPGFSTGYHFEFTENGLDWTSTPVPDANVGTGTSPVSVSQSATGLTPNTTYEVKVVATTGNVCETNSVHFTTLPAPPSVRRTIALPVSGSSATLRSEINPNKSGAIYHFVWGTTSSYGQQAPLETEPFVGEGKSWVPVKANVTGLKPGTTYHFRVVATGTTGAGTTFGPDTTFTTSACDGLSASGLPDCRVFELVSPADKGPVGQAGTSSLANIQIMKQVAPDGDHIAYPITYGTPTSTAGGEVAYRATRSSSGWSSLQMTPPALIPPVVVGESNLPGAIVFYPDDLSCALLGSFEPLTGAEAENETAVKGLANLFRRNSDGSYDLLTSQVPTNITEVAENIQIPNRAYDVLGADQDCGHAVVESPLKYPGIGYSGAYEVTDSGLVNIGVIPGPSGPVEVPVKVGADGLFGNPMNAVSRDGLRTYFEATSATGGDIGRSAIFLRENGAVGVDVSQSTTAVPNAGPSEFQTATPDGEHMFFTARSGLAPTPVPALPDSCVPSTGEGCSLYEYDAGTDALTDLSVDALAADAKGPGVLGVVAASDDGSSVYFATLGQLIAGEGRSYAENKAQGRANLLLNRDGDLRFVGNVDQGDLTAGATAMLTSTTGNVLNAWRSRVTPDGSRLIFASRAPLTGYDSGGVAQAFLYDADADVLTCVSCRTDGQPSVGGAQTTPLASSGSGFLDPLHPPVTLSDDGQRVFFSTPDPLVPGAVSGNENIYEWSKGTVYLLATAPQGQKRVAFAGSSTDGDVAFIVSLARLSPVDVDRQLDIYALTVNGTPGVAPQPPSVCDPLNEESCAGPPSGQPASALPPASTTLVGPGNQVEPPAKKKPAKKKKKAKKKGSKGKKGKAKGSGTSRPAKTNGRVSK